jgi:CelD/BcsL family acetyltransferase involved in cellulose biosynthesis
LLKVYEINDFDEFASLRNKWNKVLSDSKDDSPLLTWEKMAASVLYFEKKQKLRILCVKEDKKIVAIAPLRQSRIAFKGSFGYEIIEPIAYGNTDYSSFILSDKPFKSLYLLLTYLGSKNDWDYLYIHDIPEKSIMLDLLLKNKRLFPRIKIENGIICPYITIPTSMEAFFKSLSANFRKNLRKSLRKLEHDHGKVEFKEYNEIDSLDNSLDIFFNLHQKRWILKGYSGNFSEQKQRNIFRSTAKLFSKKNWLGLYFLTIDNKPLAAKYCLNYKQKLYGNLSGWDPEYYRYSIGNLLMMKILEKCVQEKIKEYDFMQGDEMYKFKWTKKYRRNSNIVFINSKVTSQIINKVREISERMKILNSLGRVLGRKPTPLPAR